MTKKELPGVTHAQAALLARIQRHRNAKDFHGVLVQGKEVATARRCLTLGWLQKQPFPCVGSPHYQLTTLGAAMLDGYRAALDAYRATIAAPAQ